MTFVIGKFITKIQAINTQNEELGFTQKELIILSKTAKTITIISTDENGNEYDKKCKIYLDNEREYIKYFISNIGFGDYHVKTYADELVIM